MGGPVGWCRVGGAVVSVAADSGRLRGGLLLV